jgi:hypothetical protein
MEYIGACPWAVSFINNKPLMKLLDLSKLSVSTSLIKASERISEYPRNEIIVSINYGQPKIFFNNFRVWAWAPWLKRNTPGVPTSISFSPCSATWDDLGAIHWCIHLLEKVKFELNKISELELQHEDNK